MTTRIDPIALGFVPLGHRRDGSPIWPIVGGDGSQPVEMVELDESAADTIADKVAERMHMKSAGGRSAYDVMRALQPQRTDFGESGVMPKPNEGWSAKHYGGLESRYTILGATDSDIAVGAFLAKTILECRGPDAARPARKTTTSGEPLDLDRLNEVMLGAATKAIATNPGDILPYAPNGAGGMKAIDVDRFVGATYTAMRAEARTKAMVSTTAGAGDEWVPTFATSELWRDVHLRTDVSANVVRVAMPTNPYTLPTLDADMVFRYAPTENVAVTVSDPDTGNATLTARKVQAEVNFSGEVTEDSIVPLVPSLRATLVRRGAQTIDDILVSGDTETGSSGNVNSDDQAIAADSFSIALNGMRKFCIVTNTGQVSNVAGALSAANFTTIRRLLGRYGARASDLRIVAPASTYVSMQDIEEVQTVDKYAINATIVQGELARFYGIPIVLYEAIPHQDDDLVAADGKADAATPANNTLGWILVFNVNGWKLGFRREFQIESDRNIQTDTNILVASFRMAQIPNGITTIHTAVGRNVTV